MMKKFRYTLLALLFAGLMFSACEKPEVPVEPDTNDPIVEQPDTTDTQGPGGNIVEKPQPKKVSLWISTSVNFSRLKTKANIKHFMDLIQQAGFNEIIVEVKTMQGKALYFSDILDYQTEANGVTVQRDWDYLQYFIDQAHQRGMTILAASTVMPDYRDEWTHGGS